MLYQRMRSESSRFASTGHILFLGIPILQQLFAWETTQVVVTFFEIKNETGCMFSLVMGFFTHMLDVEPHIFTRSFWQTATYRQRHEFAPLFHKAPATIFAQIRKIKRKLW